MKKCVKLFFEVNHAQEVLKTFILQKALEYKIEGIGQKVKDETLQLYVCGTEELVDEFIDCLYLGYNQIQFHNIKIETCSTDRSYRGVFRIVE